MLGRLILILVQLVVGWYASIEIMKNMPGLGKLDMFVIAAVFAVVVWAIGLLSAAVLKDVSQPGPSTLIFAFGAAVLFAAVTFFPDAQRMIASVAGSLDVRLYPLIGAVVGYAVQS